MMKKTLAAALLGATLLGGGAYAATQTAAPAAHGPMRADTNKDGVITRAEAIAAAEARFAKADANKDGKLTGDELRAMRPHRGGHFGPGRGMGQDGGMRAKLLERFDTDKDGKLSDSERVAAKAAREKMRAQMLAKFDTDKDGKLSPAEREAARASSAFAGFGGRHGPRAPGTAPEGN